MKKTRIIDNPIIGTIQTVGGVLIRGYIHILKLMIEVLKLFGRALMETTDWFIQTAKWILS